MTSMDPDPSRTPDLEPGGGVPPGATPPDTPQTSGLSAPEPDTRHRFPFTGIAAIVVTVLVVAVFLVVAVALVISLG
ncbi:hypothetical protein IU453_27205 [Nocardia cyriacigeorgica]|uniref:Uncharacterized protein n=2 Tax=Nocardia cyriacigeorgica TaxID=135487 RepID=A0A4U8VU45_9NOCA|nr:DUF6480 family protein [Nocardia cyriacigeorgica]MBF6162131.1 hypothetical protein [Nocardia cyriacigeorgica]MBF6200807.1 hypothetical protein [Nocardia cyriacigeorgica]MBF6320441.1 hypothetical protein [Nocardia cyriacigeorgica]MBF6416402.1 hypothetical protein [Nocardia cyriacigeorgica]MBF6534928.1 hypothetical protein [Nocardia cyriacigeorgica]